MRPPLASARLVRRLSSVWSADVLHTGLTAAASARVAELFEVGECSRLVIAAGV